MIVLITYLEKETNTKMVSHGYNTDTDTLVILPNSPLREFSYTFDSVSREYILN